MKKRPTITKYKIKEFKGALLFFFSMVTRIHHWSQHWWLEGFAISFNGSWCWPDLGYFQKEILSQELQVFFYFLQFHQKLQHPSASVSEEGYAGRNTKEAPNTSFNWKTLWNCHSFNSCRNPMGLVSELFVEDVSKGDIYELASLQPSLCFCLYQHFLMPSQGGGGEGVGSGVFSGEWRAQQVLNSVNDCRKWFVSLEVVPARSQCPSQKLTCSSLKIDCAKHQGALGNLQPQFPRQGAPEKQWNASLPAAALWTKPTLTGAGLLCKFSGFISAVTKFC